MEHWYEFWIQTVWSSEVKGRSLSTQVEREEIACCVLSGLQSINGAILSEGDGPHYAHWLTHQSPL